MIDEAVTDSAPTLDLWYTVIDANEVSKVSMKIMVHVDEVWSMTWQAA